MRLLFNQNRLLPRLSASLLLAMIATTAAAVELQPFEAKYSFSLNGTHLAVMTRNLRHNADGSYLFESISKATSLLALVFKEGITERSIWSFHNGKPRPMHYIYHRGGNKKRHVELDFDWDKGFVTNIINNDPWKMRLGDGTQDKLLYQLKMMLDLQQGQKDLVYSIADGGKLKTYHFTWLGEETIKTAMGRIKTVKLLKDKNGRATTVWCAIDLNYLPVRIAHTEKNGDRLTYEVMKVSGLPLKRGKQEE